MSLENVNYLAQTIASFAVVVSLILLVLQARLGIQMMRGAAIRNHAEKIQSPEGLGGQAARPG